MSLLPETGSFKVHRERRQLNWHPPQLRQRGVGYSAGHREYVVLVQQCFREIQAVRADPGVTRIVVREPSLTKWDLPSVLTQSVGWNWDLVPSHSDVVREQQRRPPVELLESSVPAQ